MKETKLSITEYACDGMKIVFEKNSKIKVEISDGYCIIEANKEGLISLAKQFLNLAEVQGDFHYHLEEGIGLENGSDELVICKDDDI